MSKKKQGEKKGLAGYTAFEGGSGMPTIWILLPRRLVQFKEAGYLREGRSLWEEEWWGKPALPPTAQIRDNAKQSQKEKIKEPVSRSREIATERSKIKQGWFRSKGWHPFF